MGETTGIAWTDHTFNPWLGCEKVSPGCDNCYAERGSRRFQAQHGLELWRGDRHVTSASYWMQPHQWNRAAAKRGTPAKVFCGSWCDIAEILERPDEEARSSAWVRLSADLEAARRRLWGIIDATPMLVWQLLTKRPQNLRHVLPERWRARPPPNVWLGTTCENQAELDLRLPILLDVPARVHFVSAEPLLEEITLTQTPMPEWIIVGGESGPRSRPFSVVWASRLLAECREKLVPCFVKQMGSVWAQHAGSKTTHGDDPFEWWPELRVQEFPIVGEVRA